VLIFGDVGGVGVIPSVRGSMAFHGSSPRNRQRTRRSRKWTNTPSSSIYSMTRTSRRSST